MAKLSTITMETFEKQARDYKPEAFAGLDKGEIDTAVKGVFEENQDRGHQAANSFQSQDFP